MPIIRTADRSQNSLVNGFRLRASGRINNISAAPSLQFVGLNTSGTGNVTVQWPNPSQHRRGDLALLVVECGGDDSTVSLSGWTHVTGSPVVDVADATGSKLQVLWKFAAGSSESNVTIPDAGDHLLARILTFRGVRQDVPPGQAVATAAKTTASTDVEYPAIATVASNSLVLCIATRPDDTASTTTFSDFANANLTSAQEILTSEVGTAAGHGGGFVVNSGIKATPGDIGASTGTMTVSVTNALMTLALEPSLALPA